MSRLFEWSERGQRVELFTLPGIPGGILEARSDGRHGERIELPREALTELLGVLVDHLEDERIPQLEHALGMAEQERDEANDRAKDLEGELRAALADLERHRTALDLSDQRVRALEQRDGFCSCWSDGTLARDCGVAAHREGATS